MPTPKLSAIGRLNIAGETSFGNDASANADFVRSLVIDPSSLTVEAITDEHLRAVDYETAKILGKYNGTLTTSHYLHGFAASVPTAPITLTDSSKAAATAWDHLAAILASASGNYKLGGQITGGTVSKSGTPTDTVTEATLGTKFGDGEPVAWATGDTYLPYFVSWLTNITSGTPDAGSLLQTTPPLDPQGTTLHGGSPVVWTPSTGEVDPYHANASNGHSLNAPAASWTLELLGHAVDNKIKCYGCRPIGLKMSFPIGQLPTVEITWGVAHWEMLSSGGEPSIGTYSYPEPEPCLSWWCAWGTTASDGSGGGSLQLKELSIDMGISRNPIEDGSTLSGVGGWFTVTRKPRISFKIHRSYSGEITDFEAQNGKPFTFQTGSQPGKMIAFAIPNSRIVELPKPGDDNGAVMSSITIAPNYYSGDTDAASEIVPSNSDFRLAFI